MIGKRLAILGGGGHGRVVADAAGEAGWKLIEFFDDGRTGFAGHWAVKGNGNVLLQNALSYDGVVVAIGDNATRLQWIERLLTLRATLVNIVHPRATVSRYVQIGVGTVVMAGAVINYGVSIGRACIVNTGATIDHDTSLGDAVHVSPGVTLSGSVTVGSRVWLGAGAVVKNGIAIEDDVTVGLGSAVIRNVNRGLTVVGVPAREAKAKI